ncbi:TetR/AcrR family transcriptional regulator [Crossiella cryophila]
MRQTDHVPPQNEARKKHLADAAIDVLARDGGHGLTHRTVDKHAAVPTGTTSNYFRTRDALWVAVANRVAERHWEIISTIEGFPEKMATPNEASEAISLMLTGMADEGRIFNLAMLELNLEAIRRPGLRPTLHELNELVTRQMGINHRLQGLPADRETLDMIGIFLRGLQLSMLMPWNLGQAYDPARLIERAYGALLATAPDQTELPGSG